MNRWRGGAFTLRHFSESEFQHPHKMDVRFLRALDEFRAKLGYPVAITDDFRTDEEMRALYGDDEEGWPDSAHRYGTAVDCVIRPFNANTRFQARQVLADMIYHGDLPWAGIGHYDGHLHIDSHEDRPDKRPAEWVGVSK